MITVESFETPQAQEVSDLICRNFREVNSKYYDDDFLQILLNDFSPQRILEKSEEQYIFVAMEEGVIVGTGALENKGTSTEPHYYCVAMFVLPEHHGKGIGSMILQKVEDQTRALGATKLQLRAARGAFDFYRKAGFVSPHEEYDKYGNLLMERTL